ILSTGQIRLTTKDREGKAARVSVIVPVFNGAETIGAAIESVRDQTFADRELVVVDDGSTDDSADIVTALARECRLRLVRQENAGLAAARNRGIAESSAELVAFLD